MTLTLADVRSGMNASPRRLSLLSEDETHRKGHSRKGSILNIFGLQSSLENHEKIKLDILLFDGRKMQAELEVR